MDEMRFMGYLVGALIALGGLIGMAIKFTQPINKLNITIQQLIDTITNLKEREDKQDKKLEKHDGEIDELKIGIHDLKTKMDFFHRNN